MGDETLRFANPLDWCMLSNMHTETETQPSSENDSGRRLTASEWAEACTQFERGEKSVRQLANDYGISRQAMGRGLKSRGVTRNSRLDEVRNETDEIARREREAKIQNANAQVENFAKYNDVIVKLVMKRVIDGDRGDALATKHADILVLKNAAAVVERARRENWDILQIEDLLGEDAKLPDLNIGEYTPEELEAIRAANEEHYQEGLDDGSDDEHDGEGDEDLDPEEIARMVADGELG